MPILTPNTFLTLLKLLKLLVPIHAPHQREPCPCSPDPDLVASVPSLAKHGTNQHDGAGGDVITSKPTAGSTGATYLAARLKRDAPEIAVQIDKFPSIRAAAKAAGLIKDKTLVERVMALWRRATPAGVD